MDTDDVLRVAEELENAPEHEKPALFKALTDRLAGVFGISKSKPDFDDDDDDDDEDYDIDDDGLDEDEDEDETGDVPDEDEDEDRDDDETAKKSFADYIDEGEILPEVVDGEPLIGELLEAFGKALDDANARMERRLRRIEKSVQTQRDSLAKALGEVRDDLDQIGATPRGTRQARTPAEIMKAVFSGGDRPDVNAVVEKSITAVKTGAITGQQQRMLELAAQSGQWDDTAERLWRRCLDAGENTGDQTT